MTQRDPLDDLLDQSSPLLDAELETAEFGVLLADLGTAARLEMVKTRPSPRRRSRVRKAAAAVVALVVVTATVSGVPAAAEWIGLHTGQHELGNPWHPQPKTPENELWRADSPELRPYLEEFARDYPLAPGYTVDPLTRTPAEPYPTLLTRLQVREEVFYFSECTWVETWLRADRRRDDDTKAAATQALVALPAKLDAPVALSADQGVRDLQRDLAVAAELDQRPLLERELRLNCGDLK